MRKALSAILLSLMIGSATFIKADPPQPAGINVPVTYYKLPHGLKVVLSPEHSAPLVTVAVYYNIGWKDGIEIIDIAFRDGLIKVEVEKILQRIYFSICSR